MKNNIAIICALIALTLSIFTFFKSKTSAEVVYINTNKLLSEYKGMKAAQQIFDKESLSWKANVDTLGKEFERTIKKFEKDRSTMSKKEIVLTEELLQKKQQEYYQYQQAMQKKAGEEEQKYKSKIAEQLSSFLKEYGKEHGYTYILGATNLGNIVYADDRNDITEDVLKVLNK